MTNNNFIIDFDFLPAISEFELPFLTSMAQFYVIDLLFCSVLPEAIYYVCVCVCVCDVMIMSLRCVGVGGSPDVSGHRHCSCLHMPLAVLVLYICLSSRDRFSICLSRGLCVISLLGH